MRLKSVYARFYKSFNFDYLRKYHKNSVPKPWDDMNGKFYPFIRVPTEKEITTIVGANGSGKSHLLTAIEKGISTREQAALLLENIEANLDDSTESDEARTAANVVRREFDLDMDVTEAVPDYDKFKERLSAIQYAQRIALSSQDLDSAEVPSSSPVSGENEHAAACRSTPVMANGDGTKKGKAAAQPGAEATQSPDLLDSTPT
jgi:hypothetical protein